MILNLLRVEALKIEEMIKRSFSEHATQQLLPEHEKDVKLAQADLAKVKRESCNICDEHMDDCHQAAQDYKQLTLDLYKGLLNIPLGRRIFCQQRMVVFNWDGVRTAGVLLSDGMSPRASSSEPALHVCAIKPMRERRDATDQLPFVPAFRNYMHKLPVAKRRWQVKTLHVPLGDVECVSRWVVKGVIPEIFQGGDAYPVAREKIQDICGAWDDRWDEADMAKVKNMQLQEMVEKRAELVRRMTSSPSTQCPGFLKHVSLDRTLVTS